MKQGMYKAAFSTPAGGGTGAIYIENGKARGGDSTFAYSGDYTESNDKFTATLLVTEHTHDPKARNPFGGLKRINLSLSGTIAGNAIAVSGQASEAPGLLFKAKLDWLSD
jgi:hypothetical protein